MKKLILLAVFVVFYNCKSTTTVVTETKDKVTTLTNITETKLDTTFVIPEEKVSIVIPIEKIKIKHPGQKKMFTQKQGRASVKVVIDSIGTIKATASCDSIETLLNYYKKEVKQLRIKTTDTKKKVTKKKGYNLLEVILFCALTAVISFAAAYLLKTFKII